MNSTFDCVAGRCAENERDYYNSDGTLVSTTFMCVDVMSFEGEMVCWVAWLFDCLVVSLKFSKSVSERQTDATVIFE
jgi:hypothetical protein